MREKAEQGATFSRVRIIDEPPTDGQRFLMATAAGNVAVGEEPPYPCTFWRVLLQRDAARPTTEPEPAVRALPLTLRPFVDTPDGEWGAQGFKVGGTPSWAQFPEHYRCACGAELLFVCQVPEGWEFDVCPGLPEQPDTLGSDSYVLFLANEVYLLAYPARCDPAAVWPVNQN
ncbi:DUF6879 family protein [Streptomyces sp. NPDC001820]|uniref:DUF6879 family protein n=1 Tax=Streptomyces sp. NPDC001820 TaxID=3364613 RepID=UPI0036771265